MPKGVIMHRTIENFWRQYSCLPKRIRDLADKSFALLKENSRHPSLRFKKIGRLWSVRIGEMHRALAVKDGNDYIWVWIGSHDDYEEMLHR